METAKDSVQEFFALLSSSGGLLERALRENGTIRSYLMEALRHLVADNHRRNRKQAMPVHPDQPDEGRWDVMEISRIPGAEAAFHNARVKTTLAEDSDSREGSLYRRRQ